MWKRCFLKIRVLIASIWARGSGIWGEQVGLALEPVEGAWPWLGVTSTALLCCGTARSPAEPVPALGSSL